MPSDTESPIRGLKWILTNLFPSNFPDLLEGQPPGTYEKARLRFAHAETIVPFSCLLGLFLEGFGEHYFSGSPQTPLLFLMMY